MLHDTIAFITDAPGLTPWVFVLMCAISFIGSTLAGTVGLGGGALVIAVMALFFPPASLIPLHGVVQIGSNFGRAMLMRRDVITRYVVVFAAGSVIGAAIGANLVVALPVALLQVVLAAFVVYAAWAPGFRAGRPSRPKFFGVGVGGAFITMFVGASGAFIAPFVATLSTDRRNVVATHGALMTLQHGLKILAFGLLGFAYLPYVPLLIGMLCMGFLGSMFGRHLLHRLPERAFRLGLRIVLSVLAVRLLWGALS